MAIKTIAFFLEFADGKLKPAVPLWYIHGKLAKLKDFNPDYTAKELSGCDKFKKFCSRDVGADITTYRWEGGGGSTAISVSHGIQIMDYFLEESGVEELEEVGAWQLYRDLLRINMACPDPDAEDLFDVMDAYRREQQERDEKEKLIKLPGYPRFKLFTITDIKNIFFPGRKVTRKEFFRLADAEGINPNRDDFDSDYWCNNGLVSKKTYFTPNGVQELICLGVLSSIGDDLGVEPDYTIYKQIEEIWKEAGLIDGIVYCSPLDWEVPILKVPGFEDDEDPF